MACPGGSWSRGRGWNLPPPPLNQGIHKNTFRQVKEWTRKFQRELLLQRARTIYNDKGATALFFPNIFFPTAAPLGKDHASKIFPEEEENTTNSLPEKLAKGNKSKLSMDLVLEHSTGKVDLETKYFYIFNSFYEQYCAEKRKELATTPSDRLAEHSPVRYSPKDVDALKEDFEREIERELAGFINANSNLNSEHNNTHKPISKSCSTTPNKESTKWALDSPVFFCLACTKRLISNDNSTPQPSLASSELTGQSEYVLHLDAANETLSVEVEVTNSNTHSEPFPEVNHNQNAFLDSSSSSQEDASMEVCGGDDEPLSTLVHSDSNQESIGFVVEYEEDAWLEFKGVEKETSQELKEQEEQKQKEQHIAAESADEQPREGK